MSVLLARLRRIHRTRLAARATADAAMVLSLGAVVWAALAGADAMWPMPGWARAAAGLCGIGAVLAAATGSVMAGRRERWRPARIAREASERSDVDARPITVAADLADERSDTGQSEPLKRAAIARGEQYVGRLRLTALIPTGRLLVAAGVVIVAAGGVFWSESQRPGVMGVAMQRFAQPLRDHLPWQPVVINITTAPEPIALGEPLTISARVRLRPGVTGDAPRTAAVMTTARPMTIGSLDSIHADETRPNERTLTGVITPRQQRTTVFVQTSRGRSDAITIHAHPRPLIERITARITPPSYTALPSRSMPAAEGVSAVTGSRIRLEIAADQPIRAGQLRTGEHGHAAEVRGHAATVTLELTESQRGDVTVRGEHGLSSDPLPVTLLARPDAPPTVSLGDVPSLILAPPTARLSWTAAASDDLGLRAVRLMTEHAGASAVLASAAWEIDAARTTVAFDATLDLSAASAEAGQSIHVWAEASDHRPGRSLTASRRVEVRIVEESTHAEAMTMARLADRIAATLAQAREAMAALEQALASSDPNLASQQAELSGIADQLAELAASSGSRTSLGELAEALDRAADALRAAASEASGEAASHEAARRAIEEAAEAKRGSGVAAVWSGEAGVIGVASDPRRDRPGGIARTGMQRTEADASRTITIEPDVGSMDQIPRKYRAATEAYFRRLAESSASEGL